MYKTIFINMNFRTKNELNEGSLWFMNTLLSIISNLNLIIWQLLMLRGHRQKTKIYKDIR